MVHLASVTAWGTVFRAAGGVRRGVLSSVFVYPSNMCTSSARSRDGLYEPALADSEREAVADLLQYLENVSRQALLHFDESSYGQREARQTFSRANHFGH